MNVLAGSLVTVLGPLPCVACGRPVVWGVATQLVPEANDQYGEVRRRDLWDKATGHPHRCRAERRAAA